MRQLPEADRDRFLTTYSREAVHLEMRDVYATTIEHDRFDTWRNGNTLDPDTEAEWWRPWFDLMKANTDAGKTLRRLRIVSEPVSQYIRFERMDADNLVKAGEDVRWLPRRNASELMLPGNDFWMFDAETVVFTNFDGDGHVLDHDLTTDPDIVERCSTAFEAAWLLAVPNDEYHPE